MYSITKGLLSIVMVLVILSGADNLSADENEPILYDVQQTLEEKAQEAEKIEARREEAAKAQRQERAQKRSAAEDEIPIEEIELPEDTSPRFNAKYLRIIGNSLIPTSELLQELPLVYNASQEPLSEAESESLYDLAVVHELINEPGQLRQISTRTIQGLTQYILSVYQSYDYAGVYVYVPAGAIKEGVELHDEFLVIKVLEANVLDVGVTSYDVDRNEVEKG